MATAKKTASKKTAAKKTASKKAVSKKTASTKGAAKKAAAKSSAAQPAAKRAVAKKSAAKKTAAKAKKESLVKQKRSTGDGPACWPGYERVPGKEAGTKGSCKPKKNQTAGERKQDGREAAASKLHKAGGSKARANRTP